MTAHLSLGTCGWSYEHWKDVFYPPGLKSTGWLSFVAQHQNTVEVDSFWHAIQRQSTVQKWVEQTPEGFTFSAKVFKGITQEARLRDCRPLLEEYLTSISPLANRLEAVCIQLPPSFHAGLRDDLIAFFGWLPDHLPWAVEFRHKSWFNDDAAALVAKHGVTWVNTDQHAGFVDTPAFTYIRLLGDARHDTEPGMLTVDRGVELDFWARRLRGLMDRQERIAVYINNNFEGHSPLSLIRLRERLARDRDLD